MTTIRRTLVAAGVILAAALVQPTFAAAQQGPPRDGGRGSMRGDRRGQPSVDQQVNRLTTNLSLTPAQVTQVRALITAQHAMTDSMQAKARASRDADRKQMDAMRENMQKSLDGLLTPEQRTKHQAMMQRRDGRKGSGGSPRRGGDDRRDDDSRDRH